MEFLDDRSRHPHRSRSAHHRGHRAPCVGLSRTDASRSEPSEPPSAAAAGTTATTERAAEQTPTVPEERPPLTAPTAEGRVTLTARDGKVTTVFGGSFRHRQTSRELYLQSGQQIAFNGIKSIEFTRQDRNRALVRVTLVNGAVHEDVRGARAVAAYGFSGTNNLGSFEISVSNLARITLER